MSRSFELCQLAGRMKRRDGEESEWLPGGNIRNKDETGGGGFFLRDIKYSARSCWWLS